jgi:hypothetical protein
MLRLKQEISKLSRKQLAELNAYMLRLRHQSPEWKRETARRIKVMQAGRYVTLGELEKRIAQS